MRKTLSCLFALIFIITAAAPMQAQAASYHIDFDVNSAAALLVSLDTDTPVYEKNADTRREPASLTKIMMYIVVTEQVQDPDDTQVPYTREMQDVLQGTGSSTAGLKVGDVLTVTQMLQCLMIPSGNDAAIALAHYVGKGSVAAAVELMNKKAAELGCKSTHFMNPHGLHDDEHYTTARDMAVITQYAMTLPRFMDICDMARCNYTPVGGPDAGKNRLLTTTNMLIDKNTGGSDYYPNARGIKTGSHDQAGFCLVTTATKSGQSYLCVVLGAPNVDDKGKSLPHTERTDTRSLYDWAFGNLKIKKLVSKEDVKSQVGLQYAWKKDSLLLAADRDFSAVLPKDVAVSSVLVKVDKPETLEAPVKKGQVVGKMTLSYAGQELAVIDLVATESVERSELLKTTDNIKTVLTSGWFLTVVAVIVVLVSVYIVLALIYNRKKKNLRKVKKYKKF